MNIKEGRKTNFFWAHNAIFDRWGAKLKGNGIAVYLCLIRHSNNDGTCYPSLNTIAKKCGICRNTVIRTIDKLVELGLIVREKREGSDGQKGRTSNLYTIVDISEAVGVGVQGLNYMSIKERPKRIRHKETHSKTSTTESKLKTKTESKSSSSKKRNTNCQLDKKTKDLSKETKKTKSGSTVCQLENNTLDLPLVVRDLPKDTNCQLDKNTLELPLTNLPKNTSTEKQSKKSKQDKATCTKNSPKKGTLKFDFSLQKLSEEQMQNAKKILDEVPIMDRQLILDELNSALAKNNVKSPICYLNTLVERYNNGKFIPTSDLFNQRIKPIQKATNSANSCKFCKGSGQIRFIRQDGTLTELIDCKHGQFAHKYIQSIKEDYGYDLQPHKATMPHQLPLDL